MFSAGERVLIQSAEQFAREVFAGQVRNNKSRQPVIEHAAEVAELVTIAGGDAVAIASGWLHDVREDTKYKSDHEIRIRFGGEVADTVDGLTDPPEYEGMPLGERKALQAQRILTKGLRVKLCKIGDQTSNIRSVVKDPPLSWDEEKCRVYIFGAWMIVRECLGTNHFLETIFQEELVRAMNHFKFDMLNFKPRA